MELLLSKEGVGEETWNSVLDGTLNVDAHTNKLKGIMTACGYCTLYRIHWHNERDHCVNYATEKPYISSMSIS